MAPLAVDPEALFVAGTGVSVVGDGIAAALGPFSAGFGINSGQDSAGMIFALNYQNAARSLLTGVAAGINACRKLGAKIQLCASNYSRAETASKVGGGGHALPSPGPPAKVEPPNAPGVMGAGVARPLLWGVVESLLDDVWPNGNAVGMHAAAGCWRGLGVSLSGVQAALNGPKSAIAGQQIPEGELIQHDLALLAATMGKFGEQCDKVADTLDKFADEVDDAQNKIRDLLKRLGSLTDLVHDAMLIFEGDALDELEKIAKDINGVLHNMKREAHAREQVLKTGMQIIDGLVVQGKKLMEGQLVEFLGEDVGSVAAGYFDSWADFGEGVFKGTVGAVEFGNQLDPSRFAFDPKGAAASWAALDKTAVQSIPAYALFDPGGAAKTDLGLAKGLTHWDDLTSDRPAVGLGEIGFDLATMAGGGGAAKAGGKAAEAAGGAEATGELTKGEEVLQGAKGAAAGAEGAGGALPGIAKTGSDLTKDLENLGGDLPKGDAPPSGGPVNLPTGKLPEVPVESAPRPVDGAPGAPHSPTTAPGPTPPEAPRPDAPTGPHEPAPAPASAPTVPGGLHDPVPVPGEAPGPQEGVPAGGPHGPTPAPPSEVPPPPAGGPLEPASVLAGDPHEPGSVAEGPREPTSLAGEAPHETAPSDGPHEPVSPGGPHEQAPESEPRDPGQVPSDRPHEPAGVPSGAPLAPLAAAAGERAPAAIPHAAEYANGHAITPHSAPLGAAPTAPSSLQAAPSAKPVLHSPAPSGSPTEVPAPASNPHQPPLNGSSKPGEGGPPEPKVPPDDGAPANSGDKNGQDESPDNDDHPLSREDPLSPEHLKPLADYTGMGYTDLNEALRGEALDASQAARVEALKAALSKLPPFEGSVVRGTNLPPEVLAQYRPGDYIIEKAFLSTTRDPVVAQSSAFAGNVEFRIVSFTGRDVSAFSMYPAEQEVLFPANTRFLVLRKTIDPRTGRTIIDMVED
ncbi:ADP-ribosyltransferase [Mycobacterium colombiense]|uniref:ADP-ribosyltransferase n=1 Tax=Mycobacterium colombiense TaxID=339268 RepID=UPI001154C8A0|nr:ADP-ribosyltransferase [Mycobacterium colombiense]